MIVRFLIYLRYFTEIMIISQVLFNKFKIFNISRSLFDDTKTETELIFVNLLSAKQSLLEKQLK